MPTEMSPVAEKLSDSIVEQIRPVVAQFGFTRPSWDYSAELDIVRVQFDDPRSEKAVQVDCDLLENSCSANYCRMEGRWQVCVEGKQKSLAALRATLPRWIRRHCGECRTKDEAAEEAED